MPLLYDAENRWGADDEWFLGFVGGSSRRVLDLGCGTGRLTVALAAAGHRVTGVDPDPVALTAGRDKPHGDRAHWVAGTSACLGSARFDTVLMTSHVAQVFIRDDEWAAVLADLHRCLVPDGLLAFDSRDPRAEAWRQWSQPESHGTVSLSDGTSVEVWTDVLEVEEDVVTFSWHNVFPDGTRIEGASSLRFRTEASLREALREAGFQVDRVFGGWQREPVGSGSGEIVVVAHRTHSHEPFGRP